MEKEQIVVDVEASPLPESMQGQLKLHKKEIQCKLDTLWGHANETDNFTIFRTPHNISKSKKNLFEPSVVSIGPFHHGQKHLRTLEEQKWWILQDLMSLGDHINLDLCISEMMLLEDRTRSCYGETFDDLDSKAFVEMMLLDGCFVLGYFCSLITRESLIFPIAVTGWNSNFILPDLLLLENQIPFFIVEKLYKMFLQNEDCRNFAKCIGYTFEKIQNSESSIPDPPAENPESVIPDPQAHILDFIPDPPTEIHHLVHLYYHYTVPSPEKAVVLSSKSFDLTKMFSANRIKGFLHRFLSRVLKRRSPHSTSRSLSVAVPNSTRNISAMVFPSATELKEAGLKFTPKSNPKHMLDISFEYGFLKIPRVQINDYTKSIFANLIAFEQSQYDKAHSPFTSFVIFLDNLVNTQYDVTILQECGIIENCLSSEEALTHFFNNVTEGSAQWEGHYLAELNKEVNKYIGSRWNRQRAKLIRDYFSSPWAAISLFAAFILLVLTCIQTFYAVYAYKFPPSS